MKKSPGLLLPLLGWLGGLMILVALCIWLILTLSRQKLEDYKAELKSRGETLDLAALQTTPSPEAEQRAREFIAIGAEIIPMMKAKKFRLMDTPKESPPGMRIVFHQQELTVVSGTTAYSWEEAAAELSPLESKLARAREITEQGPLEIHPDYERGHSALIEGSNEAMNVAFALISQSYLQMRDGDTSGAARNIRSALRITDMLSRQKMVIAQVLSLGLIEIASKATWDLLQSEGVSDSSLQLLQADWENVRAAEMIAPALRYERALGMPLFDAPPDGVAALISGGRPTSPFSWPEILDTSKIYLWGIFFRNSDHLQFIKAYQASIDAVAPNPQKGPWKKPHTEALLHNQKVEEGGVSRLLSQVLIVGNHFIQLVVSTQAQAEMATTAIALRRHQLTLHTLPRTLDDLVPQFLTSIPSDPFDGQSLRYQKINEQGFLLYSVGTNFEGDGGSATSTSVTKTKDIVWPQAVTPAPAE